MNLISGVHYLCERREHAFMILRKYTIISLYMIEIKLKTVRIINELFEGFSKLINLIYNYCEK